VTDRELLELAAMAAGLHLQPMEMKNVERQGDDRFIGYMTDAAQWPRGWFNPLTDDGDALRLAVKLGITPHLYSTCVAAKRHVGDGIHCEESFNDDPCVATCRAIVRAAAQIGKAMQPSTDAAQEGQS
jgi:hypothetical protein